MDADLIEAAEEAVEQGHFVSVSAWVNEALRFKLAHDRRLKALKAFISLYESEHGEITDEEMQLAARRARESGVVVRGSRSLKQGRGQARKKS